MNLNKILAERLNQQLEGLRCEVLPPPVKEALLVEAELAAQEAGFSTIDSLDAVKVARAFKAVVTAKTFGKTGVKGAEAPSVTGAVAQGNQRG